MPLIQSPDRGLNSSKPDNQLEPTECGDSTQNIIYRNGEIRSAFGYEKFGSGSLPLDSAILDATQYPEIRTDTVHIVIASSGKLYKYDSTNDDWDDITNVVTDNLSDVNNPTSWAVVGHTDEVDSSFQHLLYCDGGKTAIQRWAGATEANFKDLGGADGYHDPASGVTTHFAQQADIFSSHVILLNAQEANSLGDLIENKQRVRWAVTGKLEVWSGTTSGFVDLIDRGGSNMRGSVLGNRYIIYQNNSVWGLNPVGGSTVFRPEILLPDLGLLAPHLLTGSNNVHYFVGDDFNIYEYYGGSVRKRISDNILKLFRADIDDSFVDRCWLTIGPENKRLWVFYVPDDKEFMTQAFALDIQQGQWMPRDFSHITAYSGNKGTSNGGGLTMAKLIGSQSFNIGDSYKDAVADGETYAEAVITTDTYADELNEVVASDKLTIGDSNGNIFQFDQSLKTDDGINIPAIHYTPVFDGQEIDKNKRWPQHHVVAKGDAVIVEYSVDDADFVDISDSGQALTSNYDEYEQYINETSKRIQFRYRGLSVDESEFLVGHWKMNGDSTDSSGNGNNGSDTTMSYSAGKINQAGDFDAAGSKITIASTAILDDIFATGGSVVFWSNAASVGENANGRAVSKEQWYCHMRMNLTTMRFVQLFSGTDGAWQWTVPSGQYNHIAITYDNSDVANSPIVYVNGSAVDLTQTTIPTGTATADTADDLVIGNIALSTRTFDGQIDDVRIYNKELVGPEVSAIYNSGTGTEDEISYDFRIREFDIALPLIEENR